ncbi:MAG: amino acid permease-associated region [Actinomycetia bacterium]|nr:amino acid permease-associated region [Actinomycetes bacterium]
MSTTTLPESPATPGLAASSMGGFEVLAQSVAGIAPSAVMATGPALVAIGAGGAIMYSYAASTVILIMVGWCITQFARREGEGGTLLSYIAKAFGPGAGFVGAVGLAFGYALIAVASLAGVALYVEPLIGLSGTATTLVIEVIVAALAALAMVRGVQLSTRVGVVLEAVSICAILVVIATVLATKGLSTAPLHPKGLSTTGVTGGMVLAILGYVGFESAACMGTEAKSPTRTIPRAVLGSVAIVTVLYLLSSYAQLIGFTDPAKITASAAPLNQLADAAGVHLFGYLIDIGATASFFACVTGSLNAAGRLAFSMGQDGLLHRAVGIAHPTRRTPHLALIGLSAACALIAVVMTAAGVSTLNVFAYTGTIGTFGYMIAYILIAVGAPVYLRKIGARIASTAVVGGLAAAGMCYVLYKNVWPVPASPYNLLPWIFLGVLLLAGGWYAIVKVRPVPAT